MGLKIPRPQGRAGSNPAPGTSYITLRNDPPISCRAGSAQGRHVAEASELIDRIKKAPRFPAALFQGVLKQGSDWGEDLTYIDERVVLTSPALTRVHGLHIDASQ